MVTLHCQHLTVIICELFAIVGSTLGHLTALLVDCILDRLITFSLHPFFILKNLLRSYNFQSPMWTVFYLVIYSCTKWKIMFIDHFFSLHISYNLTPFFAMQLMACVTDLIIIQGNAVKFCLNQHNFMEYFATDVGLVYRDMRWRLKMHFHCCYEAPVRLTSGGQLILPCGLFQLTGYLESFDSDHRAG